MKRCTLCGVEKPLMDFHVDRGKPDGKCCWCKSCVNARRKARYDADPEAARQRLRDARAAHPGRARHYRRRSELGITATQAEIEAMEDAQDHRCALCRRHESEFAQALHLDHDHETGQIRALLCGPCNRGLGYLQDSPALLRAGANYIEFHKSVSSLKEPK